MDVRCLCDNDDYERDADADADEGCVFSEAWLSQSGPLVVVEYFEHVHSACVYHQSGSSGVDQEYPEWTKSSGRKFWTRSF